MDVISGLLGLGAISGVGWSAKDAVAGLRRLHERTLSDFLPWRRSIRDDIVTTDEDEYLTVFRFAARDVGTQSAGEIFEVARRLAATIGSLKPKANIKVQFYAVREQVREYLRPLAKSANPVLDAADEECERFFVEEEPGYETVRYLSVAIRPQDEDLARLRTAASKPNIDGALAIEQSILDTVEAIVAPLKASLSDAFETVERLGVYHEVDDFGVMRRRSKLLEFLHYFVIGRFAPFNVPEDSVIELNGLLSSRGGRGRVAVPKIGDEFVLPILLKTFPKESEPQILDELTRIGVPHYFSVRYWPLTLSEVHKETRDIVLDFQGQAKQNASFVDPGAVDSAEEVADAHGAAKGAYTQFGWCIFTIVVRGRTLPEVTAAKNAVNSVLEKAGFPNAYVPEEAAWDAIVSTFPGAKRWSGIHKHLEHALGVATLVPLHAHDRGRKYSDHPYRVPKTPPHFYAVGPGQAVNRVHTSVADVEHGFGLAPSTWGKTTFQAYLALMRLARLPYSGQTTFDKGLGSASSCGSYRAAAFADGVVYEPRGDGAQGFALFDEINDPDYVDDVMGILTEIITLWGPQPSADEDRSLRRALFVMSNSPADYRSMTDLIGHLQDDTHRLGPILEKYTSAGPLGHLLDATYDSFSTRTWSVFDLEHIFAMDDPRFIVPVLRTLFVRTARGAAAIRKSLGEMGQYYQHQIVIDESHLLQGNELGQRFIRDILKTGRGKNLSVFLWSNGLEEMAASAGSTELLTQTRTRIFGGDASANDGRKLEMYRSLGLNDRALGWLPNMEPREFILAQPEMGIMQRMNARLKAPMLALIGDPRRNHIVDEFKDRFPAHRFGLHEWKVRLVEYEAERTEDPAQCASIAVFAARLRAKVDVRKAHDIPHAVLA